MKQVRPQDKAFFYLVFSDEQIASNVLNRLIGRCVELANPGTDILISLINLECKENPKTRAKSSMYKDFAISDFDMRCGTHNLSFTIVVECKGRILTAEQLNNKFIDLDNLERINLKHVPEQGYWMTIC